MNLQRESACDGTFRCHVWGEVWGVRVVVEGGGGCGRGLTQIRPEGQLKMIDDPCSSCQTVSDTSRQRRMSSQPHYWTMHDALS